MRRALVVAICTAALSFPLSTAAQMTQMNGWPMTVADDEFFSDMDGLVIADVDGDPELEIVVATSAEELFVWNPDGSEVFSADLTGLGQSVAAVGNVTGDSLPEVVVATRDYTGGNPTPTLHVFASDGTLVESGPMDHSGSIGLAPTLANVDADGLLEIVVAEGGSSTGWVYVLDGDLSKLAGWPQTLDHVPATSAAVGDIDADGEPEIAICSYSSLYVFEAGGEVAAGFPVNYAGETYSYGSPALADLDGDQTLEIVTTTHGTYNNAHVTHSDGSEMDGWPVSFGDHWSYSKPSIGDVDADGDPEVIVGRAGGTVAEPNLYVLHADGTALSGFPYTMPGGAEGSFVVADLTGDERLEIVFPNNIADDGQGYLYAVDASGQLLSGWPLRPAGMTYLNGATLADVDRDGVPELGVLSVAGGVGTVSLYTGGGYAIGAGGVHWATYQADPGHTGLYDPAYPDDDDDMGDDDDSGDDDSADDDDDYDDDDDERGGDSDDDDDDGACG